MKDSLVFGKAAIQCIADSSVTVVVSNLYIYDGAKVEKRVSLNFE